MAVAVVEEAAGLEVVLAAVVLERDARVDVREVDAGEERAVGPAHDAPLTTRTSLAPRGALTARRPPADLLAEGLRDGERVGAEVVEFEHRWSVHVRVPGGCPSPTAPRPPRRSVAPARVGVRVVGCRRLVDARGAGPGRRSYRPAAAFSASARSVPSQVNSGSLRPKCPYADVFE